jgi:hypothetical protein
MKTVTPAPVAAPAQPTAMKAKDVPVGGAFEFNGELYVRASLVGRKTGDDYGVTLKKPCRGVRLADGAVAALKHQTVTYHPAAHVRVS